MSMENTKKGYSLNVGRILGNTYVLNLAKISSLIGLSQQLVLPQ